MPGSKLPSENNLCDQFGVSRTSVRETLCSIEAQGIIEIVKVKGMFVKRISYEQYEEESPREKKKTKSKKIQEKKDKGLTILSD